MVDVAIKIENLRKQYRLGVIGGGTLSAELESWWAKKRGKEDPNTKINVDQSRIGETFYALDGVNLEVRKGEALGIIGANGAGKSTLLKLLSRVTTPTEGYIGINGRVTSMLEVGTGFHPELTGRENIYMNGAILGMSKNEIDSKMEEIIEFSECRQFIDTPVKRYSSGMYVKLGFAVAAHLESEIMIIDEVLAVGDMKFQEKCLGKMGNSTRDGKTILYVSHNMATVRKLCDRCIVLSHGKIVFDGDVEEAISYYIGETDVSKSMVNLETMKRAPEFSEHKATFTELRIESKEKAVFSYGSKIEGTLLISSGKNVSLAYLRVIIKHSDGTPVTMSTNSIPFELKGDEKNELEFKTDISMLAPGRYNLSFVLYEVNEFGTDSTLDGVHSAYVFEVERIEDIVNNMEWKNKYWGYVIGQPLEITRK